MDVLWGLGGMAALLLLALALSTDRRAIRPRTVGGALALQFGIGVLVLYWEAGERALEWASDGVNAVIGASEDGIAFLFGRLVEGEGTIFAFQVLPVVIFVASLVAVLFHLGIMQKIVHVIGGALRLLLGTSHTESLNAAANVFVGQTEAPLFIRPYLARTTRSELFAIMVGGLATVAGTVLVGYSLLGARLDYLIAASFMAAPGGLLMAKIIIPETEEPALVTGARSQTEGTEDQHAEGPSGAREAGHRGAHDRQAHDREKRGGEKRDGADDGGGDGAAHGPRSGSGAAATVTEAPGGEPDDRPRNVIDAAARGAADGLRLALNIAAMLLAFISLIALLNLLLGVVGGWFGAPDLSFEQLIGYVFAPIMTVIGVPWSEAVDSGSFVGQKIVLNEFVAFTDFAPESDEFSPKTAMITTFALTGFANFSSLAILLGGLGSLIPQRRGEIAQLGIRAVLAGTLANLMSAAIAGMFVG
ncbi:nucleoside transporter C-terminal domain-containing protein [Streptomyces sp. DSM 42041]|uniref:Nucleoside transporter C-terminal domain-containing protein n=1 Tax=Streptomyces hazeniae TaxID=3075538 RepID=A0ABU2NJK5_9ACTN|nr:nucleoside transporter C-terminal domain-containing protein [Streptomyces sp. DSM 42041]MDT0377169.1 nucleoside transporter C-terminal domain-containing protein [Streptomyces sp. DSM 42041]